jgi:LacI family transcriptional regulator
MVDGAICRSLSEEALEVLRGELETRGIPLVLVDNSFPHEWCPRVVSDDLEGGRLATAHLASLGRERIAFVSFNATAGYSCERREGYRKGLEEARLPFDEALLLELDASEDYDEALDRELWRRLKGSRADAAFCVSDGLALRVLRLCHENGVRVPEELALVGYANLDFAAQAHPPLASVAQPFYEMGVAAFERLLVSMRGKRAKRGGTTRLPVELIVRASAPIKQEKTPVASHRGATRPAARARSPGRTP